MDLNHTIVPVRDKEASAEFFARIMGLPYNGPEDFFAPVRVNDGFTMDFASAEEFQVHHYAFKVSDSEFDAIVARIETAGVAFGSHHMTPADGKLNDMRGGRGFFWIDIDGHLLEVLTRDQ